MGLGRLGTHANCPHLFPGLWLPPFLHFPTVYTPYTSAALSSSHPSCCLHFSFLLLPPARLSPTQCFSTSLTHSLFSSLRSASFLDQAHPVANSSSCSPLGHQHLESPSAFIPRPSFLIY